MRFASCLTVVIGVLLGATLAAVPARANSAPPPGPRIHALGDVVAGTDVELAWSAPPREARELEILLSVDDGAHFTLRATAEIDGAIDHARWRVPNLPTAHARLRLRWSDGAAESLAPESPAFRIVAAVEPGAGSAPDRAGATSAWDEADPRTAGPVDAGLPGFAPDGAFAEGGDATACDFTSPRAPSARAVESRLAVRLVGRPAPPSTRALAPTAPPQRRAPLRE